MPKNIKRMILYIILVVLLIVLIVITLNKKNNNSITYEEYSTMVTKVNSEFQPNTFININNRTTHIYSKVTSYPSSEWTSERSNIYDNDILKPKQIELFYLSNIDKNIITKITFFFAPDSTKKDYLKVDYFDSLNSISTIDEKYRNLSIVPHFEVAFKGKGYYVYVQTTYIDSYYKSESITTEENSKTISINADMVRQLQHFLNTK